MPFNFGFSKAGFIQCGISNKLQYEPNTVIGNGSNSTTVYEGRFEGKPVAVKQMHRNIFQGISERAISEKMNVNDINEAKILREYGHENVIRYHILDHDNRGFIYLGLELCVANLAEFLEFGKPEKLPLGEEKHDVKKHLLKGMLEGLHYLHGVGIIHNDLKPQNILLRTNKCPKKVGNMEMKFTAVISDFGMSLVIDEGRNSKTVVDDLIGTKGWRPKEVVEKIEEFNRNFIGRNGRKPFLSIEESFDDLSIIDGKIKGTKQVDIFALGCIIQYVMADTEDSRGTPWFMHPFGDETARDRRIKNNKRIAYISIKPGKSLGHVRLSEILADMLVGVCVHGDPQCRPNTAEIKQHPFFWEPTMRYQFIEKTANKVKYMESGNEALGILKYKWKQLHSWGYEKEIPNAVNYMKNFVEKSGGNFQIMGCLSVVNLLRDIRNIKQHYTEIQVEQQGKEQDPHHIVFDLKDGRDEDFDRYFFEKVVLLLPVVYTWCLYNLPRETLGAYSSFFDSSEGENEINLRERVYWKTLEKILSEYPPYTATRMVLAR